MKTIWNWIKNNPNRTMFLIPIILVAGISISHVVSWYDIANPFNWAIYLSIAIEVGAMTALVAATNKIKGGVWFMFGLVTFIQFVGNIFYSYKEIDPTGESFKMWVELTGPIWDLFSDSTDVIAMKRWLAILEGGFLPLISLASLHFFVKYEKPEDKKERVEDKVWEKVKELKKEGKLPEITEEEKEDEPTALANSEYRNEIIIEDDEDSEYFDDYPIPEENNSTDVDEEAIQNIWLESNKEGHEQMKNGMDELIMEDIKTDTPKSSTFDASEIIKRVESKEGNSGTTKSVEELQRLGNKNSRSKINRIN